MKFDGEKADRIVMYNPDAIAQWVYKKYPEYLVNNPYKTNIYYQNFLLTSKENRAKFQEKVKTNSTKKVNYL